MRVVAASILFAIVATSAFAQGEYRLQPGDKIEVEIYQEPTLNAEVLVAPDGFISFPLAGHLDVRGLNLKEVEDLLSQRFKNYFKDEMDITVSLVATEDTGKSPEALGFCCLETFEVNYDSAVVETKREALEDQWRVAETVKRDAVTRRGGGCARWTKD